MVEDLNFRQQWENLRKAKDADQQLAQKLSHPDLEHGCGLSSIIDFRRPEIVQSAFVLIKK